MYKDIRFYGQYLHESAGFESALRIVRKEMSERLPDKEAPGGYAPDATFKKEVSRFGDDFREFSRALRTRASDGKPVSEAEIKTLERAESLYAQASAVGPGVASHRLSMLEAGRNAFEGTGMSDSRLVRKLTGLDGDEYRPKFVVSVDHALSN